MVVQVAPAAPFGSNLEYKLSFMMNDVILILRNELNIMLLIEYI